MQDDRQNKVETAIRVRDLVVAFGETNVLDHLSLDVVKGEILGLVGGSGSGKSVLMRTIIGLLPKRQGSIEVLGVDLDKATSAELRAMERRWGILFQHGALFSSLSVRENVKFPMRQYLDLSPALMDEIALAKLEMVGLKARDGDKLPLRAVWRHDQARRRSRGPSPSIRRSSSSTSRPRASTPSPPATSIC